MADLQHLLFATLLAAEVSLLGSGALWKWLFDLNLESFKAEQRKDADEKIERLKDELRRSSDVQLEALKSDLRRTEDAVRTRNKWLHEERAGG